MDARDAAAAGDPETASEEEEEKEEEKEKEEEEEKDEVNINNISDIVMGDSEGEAVNELRRRRLDRFQSQEDE